MSSKLKKKENVKKVPLFDCGLCVGAVDIDLNLCSNDNIVSTMKVILPNKKVVDALYLADMEYGIIIPEKIANKINN